MLARGSRGGGGACAGRHRSSSRSARAIHNCARASPSQSRRRDFGDETLESSHAGRQVDRTSARHHLGCHGSLTVQAPHPLGRLVLKSWSSSPRPHGLSRMAYSAAPQECGKRITLRVVALGRMYASHKNPISSTRFCHFWCRIRRVRTRVDALQQERSQWWRARTTLTVTHNGARTQWRNLMSMAVECIYQYYIIL